MWCVSPFHNLTFNIKIRFFILEMNQNFPTSRKSPSQWTEFGTDLIE